MITLDVTEVIIEDPAWLSMSHEEKNHCLYLKQKELLDTFLEHGAITRAQHDRSLFDMAVKMGESC